MSDFVKCGECMRSAPWRWCCKLECGQREECKDCESEARGDKCPNSEVIFTEMRKLQASKKNI